MLASSPRSLSRSPGLRWALAVGLLYVAVLYLHFSFPGAIWGQHAISNPTISIVSNGPCAGYESFDRLVITVKTGATEALGKIPTQLQTSLRCVPPENVLLFSDMAQEIGDRHVFDSLDMIPVETMAMNSDFDIYREQQKLKDPGQIIDRLKSMKDPNNSDNLAAWSLDKYKNLHIVEKSWALNPSDWYLHIDADTYIVWSSLTAWLRRMNSSKEFNIGSMACIGSRAFCHGGSGILLSGAASRSLAVKHNGTSARWYERTKEICCGDFVLAQALDEYGIGVSNAWPVINGETPSTIPFSQEIWCLPLVTMHHVTSSEAEQLYEFEQKRANKSTPVTFAELFVDMVWNDIPDSLDNWDNMSAERQVTDVHTAEDCAKACETEQMCLQSLFKVDECWLGMEKVVYGTAHSSDSNDEKWQSTWNKTRIADWVAKQPLCGPVTFPWEDGKTSPSMGLRCPADTQESEPV